MITITESMRATKRSQLRDLETLTDKRILRAIELGTNKTVFPLDHTDALFSDLKELYEKHGYKIVPVGIVGGVRQRDYYITW